MKTPLALLQQLTHQAEFSAVAEQRINKVNQDKKSKPIKKQSAKKFLISKQEQQGKSKPKRLSQFANKLQTESTSPSNVASPLMLSEELVTPAAGDSLSSQKGRKQNRNKQSQPLLKLYRIQSEKSSKRQYTESEDGSTNYDDDSQLIDESMRSVSTSSFLIGSDEKELPDENRHMFEVSTTLSVTSDNLHNTQQQDNLMKDDEYLLLSPVASDTTTSQFSQSPNKQYTQQSQTDIPKTVQQSTPTNITTQESPLSPEFSVQPIFFMPGVPSTDKILRGENVIFKDHYKEILMYYDIIPVSRSFIEGASIPSNGPFYEIKPSDLDLFWSQKTEQYPNLAGFINKFNKN